MVKKTAGKAMVFTAGLAVMLALALDLRVRGGQPPLRVNSGRKVASLNADRLDGKGAESFLQDEFDAVGREVFVPPNSTGFTIVAECPSGQVAGKGRYRPCGRLSEDVRGLPGFPGLIARSQERPGPATVLAPQEA